MDKKQGNDIALKIAAIYLIIGALWILMSDKVLNFLVQDRSTVTLLSMVKGWIYVLISGVLIYVLISHSLRRVAKAENELLISNGILTEANRKLEDSYHQLAVSQAELEKQYQQALIDQKHIRENEERYRLISEATNDAIWKEIDGKRDFSERWFQITGHTKADLEQMDSWEELIHPEDIEDARELVHCHINSRTPFYQCEYRLKKQDGQYMWIRARGKASFNDDGKILQMAGSHTDITALKEYEHKLHYFAYNDQLTGLKNRLSLFEILNSRLNLNSKQNSALLYIDMDNFKYINDTMGHRFGDMLILKISERINSLKIDHSTLFRIGGDEFVILIEKFNTRDEIEKAAIKVLRLFKSNFDVEGIMIYAAVSIGVSIFPEHGIDTNSLLKSADIAVHKAKEAGKNRIVFYNEPMHKAINDRMEIEKQLRKAIENNEFILFYQPQIEVATGRVSGFEALLRWQSPEMGFVLPDRFIEIAEETHLIIPIGELVLRDACLFLNSLDEMGFKDLSISVNISMIQLLQDDFVDMVFENIDAAQLSPKQLELEITESILMESYEVIAGKLKLLRNRGVKIALDDFGKGYSSLNYLRELPITTLKIDKSFIDTIMGKTRDKSFTDLIIRIGRSMDLCVIAEGVETQEQMDYLVKHKCNKIQGYLYSRPIPEEEALKLISKSVIKMVKEN